MQTEIYNYDLPIIKTEIEMEGIYIIKFSKENEDCEATVALDLEIAKVLYESMKKDFD